MDPADSTRTERRRVARRRALSLTFMTAALASGMTAVVLMSLWTEGSTAVPVVDDPRGSAGLRFAFAFPDGDAPPLSRPICVTATTDRIYFVDSEEGVVRVFDDRGIERGAIGTGALEVPVYAAVDSTRGVLYVTDRKQGALLLFGIVDGGLIGTMALTSPEGSSIATAWAPLALDVGEDGTLYVTDVKARHRVLVLSPEGEVLREIGGAQAAEEATGVAVVLQFPNAVRVGAGELWVSDSNNQRSLVFGLDGAFRRVVPTGGLSRGFDFVPAVAGATDDTTLAVVDALGSRVTLMDRSGNQIAAFGTPGTKPGQLAFPNDLSVQPGTGRIFVADTGNGRIQAWDLVPATEGDIAPSGVVVSGRRRPYAVGAAVAAVGMVVFTGLALAFRRSEGGTAGAA